MRAEQVSSSSGTRTRGRVEDEQSQPALLRTEETSSATQSVEKVLAPSVEGLQDAEAESIGLEEQDPAIFLKNHEDAPTPTGRASTQNSSGRGSKQESSKEVSASSPDLSASHDHDHQRDRVVLQSTRGDHSWTTRKNISSSAYELEAAQGGPRIHDPFGTSTPSSDFILQQESDMVQLHHPSSATDFIQSSEGVLQSDVVIPGVDKSVFDSFYWGNAPFTAHRVEEQTHATEYSPETCFGEETSDTAGVKCYQNREMISGINVGFLVGTFCTAKNQNNYLQRQWLQYQWPVGGLDNPDGDLRFWSYSSCNDMNKDEPLTWWDTIQLRFQLQMAGDPGQMAWNSMDPIPSGTHELSTPCPTGTRAIAGGCQFRTDGDLKGSLGGSFRDPDDPTKWICQFGTPKGSKGDVKGRVFCIGSASDLWRYVYYKQGSIESNTKSHTIDCDPGTHVLNVGCAIDRDNPASDAKYQGVELTASKPGSAATMITGGKCYASENAKIQLFALCLSPALDCAAAKEWSFSYCSSNDYMGWHPAAGLRDRKCPGNVCTPDREDRSSCCVQSSTSTSTTTTKTHTTTVTTTTKTTTSTETTTTKTSSTTTTTSTVTSTTITTTLAVSVANFTGVAAKKKALAMAPSEGFNLFLMLGGLGVAVFVLWNWLGADDDGGPVY
ncbi:unnamed protein product [Amoebophrya sp. A25]|nr:unnamed protein product [Amoebophrya sp. A25]|eukprot:GSA25T00025727001.1